MNSPVIRLKRRYSISPALLSVAFVAVLLGWCVDHLAYKDSVNTPDKFVDMGIKIKLGRALESTMIIPMGGNDGNPSI